MKQITLFIILLMASTIGYSQAGDICFLHTATSANISGASSFIDHPALNNNPNAKIVVMHNANSDGSFNRNNHITGVWYRASTGRWAVFNEDLSNMVVSSSYNIYVSGTQGSIITVSAPSTNFYFDVDNTYMNNNPTARPILTNMYPPHNIHNDNLCGFDYRESVGKWAIFNEVQANNLPANASFNVLAKPAFIADYSNVAFVHKVTPSNHSASDGTFIDHPMLNNHPEILFVATPVTDYATTKNPDEEHQISAYYNNSLHKWTIFHEDSANIVDNTVYNIVIPTPIPANDEATGAIAVNVQPWNASMYLITTTTKNSGATSSTPTNGSPTCGSYNGGDIWYKFVAPADGQVVVVAPTGTPHWSSIGTAVYTTTTSTSPVACKALMNVGSSVKTQTYTGLTGGHTYYLRLWDWGNNNFSTTKFYLKGGVPAAIEDYSSLGFKYYPNPVENVLNISAQEDITGVSIINLVGQEVRRISPNTREIQMDLSQIPSGLYLMKVEFGNKVKTAKIQVK